MVTSRDLLAREQCVNVTTVWNLYSVAKINNRIPVYTSMKLKTTFSTWISKFLSPWLSEYRVSKTMKYLNSPGPFSTISQPVPIAHIDIGFIFHGPCPVWATKASNTVPSASKYYYNIWLLPETTSSNGNIFCVTGPLWRESTGHPSQRPVTQSVGVFFNMSLNKQLSKQWRY